MTKSWSSAKMGNPSMSGTNHVIIVRFLCHSLAMCSYAGITTWTKRHQLALSKPFVSFWLFPPYSPWRSGLWCMPKHLNSFNIWYDWTPRSQSCTFYTGCKNWRQVHLQLVTRKVLHLVPAHYFVKFFKTCVMLVQTTLARKSHVRLKKIVYCM
jgi:hypothetical protein